MEPSILIIEDSVSLLRLYSHMLRQAGYNVLEATTGDAALEIIHTRRPEIVILDRVLPDMDGSAICHTIKSTPELAITYVIMLSALRTSEDDRVSGLEAGADDYIVKPVGKRELLARVAVASRLCMAQTALRASEAKFRTLAENSPDIIARFDRDFKYIYVNPTIESYTGSKREDFIGQDNIGIALSNDQHDELQTAFKRVLTEGISESLQLTLHTEVGLRTFDARLVPEFDTDGNVTSVLTVTRDFTEHVRAEQEIARLAAVVEQTGEAVVITDPAGKIVYSNATFTAMSGYTREELSGSELPIPQHDGGTGNNVATYLAQVRSENDRWEGVTTLVCRDGTICEVEAAIFPIRDSSSGSVINYVLIQRDLTERRRAEQEREILLNMASDLRQADGRADMLSAVLKHVRAIVHVCGAAISTVDPDTNTTRVELATGCLAPLTNCIMPRSAAIMDEMLTSGRAFVTEGYPPYFTLIEGPPVIATAGIPLLAKHREIGVLWVSFDTAVNDQQLGLLHSIADRTASALRRADLLEAIQQYASDLEQRVAERTQELERANEQLRELDKLKSKFVSNVTHELRTPIGSVKLYVNLLKVGKPEKREQYEDMLQLSTDRLGQLVEDILNLSRLEMAHHRPSDFAPTDMNSVAKQVVSLHQPAADAAGVKLRYVQKAKAPLVLGDYNQLSQLVTNLVVNAINYTTQGEITVSIDFVANGSNRICLVVEDTGVGILPEDLPHIFERFYRGSHRRPKDIPGTGLGLAIVHEIVNIHGGEIELHSEPDMGTKFVVWLPADSSSVTFPTTEHITC